jgi:multidrug efflux pump subunit AcrA (membrane-fusion protein)
MHNKLQTTLMRGVETPDRLRVWIKRMAWLLLGLPAMFMFLPWQQNVTALGKVTAYSPSERVQTIDAPVSGLINRWHVQEGTQVKEGELLLEISDTDPNFKQRLEAQRDNLQSKFTAKQDELSAYELQKQKFRQPNTNWMLPTRKSAAARRPSILPRRPWMQPVCRWRVSNVYLAMAWSPNVIWKWPSATILLPAVI